MIEILNRLAKQKIQKDCDVKNQKLVAIAFTPNGRILKIETNRTADFGIVSKFSLHAEEMLCRKLFKIKARERFGKIEVLIGRWSKKWGWRLAKPCDGCYNILRKYGINRIHFTNNEGVIEDIK